LQQWKEQPAASPPSPSPTAPALPASNEGFIMVKENGTLVKVPLASLRYTESMRDYVKLFTTERRLVTHFTLKKLEEALPTGHFTRVHKSYLVRNASIEALDGNLLTLDGGTQEPVGV
jgi:DNA-binding LytR/AlgR family response regulator